MFVVEDPPYNHSCFKINKTHNIKESGNAQLVSHIKSKL